MSNGKQIWYLIKFFQRKEHAEQFMDGKLFMNRLSYFKKIEGGFESGRSDESEGVAHWWQPDDLIMKLNFPEMTEVEITKKDLAGPVTVSYDYHNHLHVFCMYAMWTDGFECIDGKIDYAQEDAEKLRTQLAIDERCFAFGEHAVVVPAVQFIERAKRTIQGIKKKAWLKLVNYFDGATFHGAFKQTEIPFNKRNTYAYQNEFRICVDSETKGNDPFILDIGTIREFSALIKSSDLNKLFKIDAIEVPPDPEPPKT